MSLRISVVVSSYNYAAYICEAVAAALQQTRPPDEIIIVDDGSTDDTLPRLQAAFGGQATVRILSRENGGQLRAMIAGTAASSGDIVCYLDADDVWEPAYLQRLAALYEADHDLDFIYCNLRYFGQREGLWNPSNEDHDHGLTVLEARFGRRWIGAPTSALSMRRAIALRALDVPAHFQDDWRTRADDVLIFGSSIGGARKFYVAEPLVRYRAHGQNSWLNEAVQPPATIFRRELAVLRLLDHHATTHGISRDALMLIKLEFRSKPWPTYAELRIAQQLSWAAPEPFGKRLERYFALWKLYWRRRSRAKQ
jgi:glycosyltransferase involved in cell wall biosynthesis